MHDHNDPFNTVDRALEKLGEREWRTPDLRTLTTQELAMSSNSRKKWTRNHLVAIVGGLAVIGAGTAFGAAYAMGAFSGKIVTDNGQEFDVQMTETAQGVYEGTTSEGHQVRFITEEAGGENRIDMFINADESGPGTYTFTTDGEGGSWSANEIDGAAIEKEIIELSPTEELVRQKKRDQDPKDN